MRAPTGQAMTEAAVVVMVVALVWMTLDRSELGLTILRGTTPLHGYPLIVDHRAGHTPLAAALFNDQTLFATPGAGLSGRQFAGRAIVHQKACLHGHTVDHERQHEGSSSLYQ